MRGTNEQFFDEILLFRLMSGNAHAAAALCLIFGDRLPLDVPGVRHRNDNFFLFNEVFHVDFAVVVGKLRLALARIIVAYRAQVGFDDVQNALFVGEDIL